MDERFLAPLVRRIKLSIARGIIKLVNDASGIQTVQLDMLANETKSNIERIQEYGFTSSPLSGSQGVALFIGGSRDHGVIVATDDARYRIKTQPGEVAIYSHEGHKIILKNGGIIELNGTNINLNCQTMQINASNSVEINSPQTNSTGDITADGISLTNHVHTGVQSGPNNTGTPI